MKTTSYLLHVFLISALFTLPTFGAPSVSTQGSDTVVEKNLDEHHDHHDEYEKQTHQGHTHGQANAKIVFASREISVEFDLPSGDLLSSEEALPLLRQPHQIFTMHPNQKDCLIQSSSFERVGLPGGHSDFLFRFHWVCENPLVLESISFRPFFDVASTVDHIEASVIAGGQILPKATLKKNSAIIKFKKK